MVFLTLVISVLCFYLFPLSIGRGLYILGYMMKDRKVRYHHLHDSSKLGRFFSVGILLMFCLGLMSRYLISQIIDLPFASIYFPLFFCILTVCAIFNVLNFPKVDRTRLQYPIEYVCLIIFLCVLSYGVVQWRSPYSLNWDLYEHQVLVNEVLNGNYSFYTSEMSDSFGFNAYPPVFHTLIATSQFFINRTPANILNYWFISGFFHLFFTLLVTAIMSKRVTKNHLLTVLCLIFSAFSFESVLAFSNVFFLPQTFAGVLTILCLSDIVRKEEHQKLSIISLISMLLALMLTHYVIGTLGALICISLYLYMHVSEHADQALKRFSLIPVGIFLATVLTLLSYQLDLGFINKGEASTYLFSFQEKVGYMRRIYGYLLLVLMPIGYFELVKEGRSRELKWALLLSLAFMVLFLSNIPYVFKFAVIGRFFITLIVSYGVWAFTRNLSFKLSKIISLGVVLNCMVVLLVLNVFEWKKWQLVDGQYTHINEDDVSTAEFLASNFDSESVMIISDPTTQYYLEGLSGVNSPGGFAIADRMIINQAFQSNDVAEKRNYLLRVSDKVTSVSGRKLYVLSGRTRLWTLGTDEEKNSFEFNIWTPQRLSFQDRIDIQTLDQSGMFDLVYQNDSMAVLEIL